MTFDDCPLVLMEWLDSAQPVARWQFLSDYERDDATQCVSVGWLIQDDDVKVLAPNMGEVKDPTNTQVCGVIRIPACAVTRVVRLKEARKSQHVSSPPFSLPMT